MDHSGLVGRAAETERLGELADRLAAGHGSVSVILGEQGIGKSALVELLSSQARGSGATVRVGAAERLEKRLPFAAIGACLGLSARSPDPRLAAVAGMLRGNGPAPGAARSRRDIHGEVTEALVAIVDEWCSAGPVLLALDDLQWADPETRLVWHLLARSTTRSPLSMITTCRPGAWDDGELHVLVQSLRGRPGSNVIELDRLSEADAMSLAEALLGRRAGPRLRSVVAGAGGNPFYVRELVRGLVRDGLVDSAGGIAEIAEKCRSATTEFLPEPLSAAIRDRLKAMPSGTQEVLGVAALLGATFSPVDLAAVAGIPASQLRTPLSRAIAEGILEDRHEVLSFRHHVVRQELLDQLPRAVQGALHEQAARALLAANSPVERVAMHVSLGGVSSGWARAWLVDEVDALTARDPALALDLLTVAASAENCSDPLAKVFRAKMAVALMWAGRFDEAETAARQVLVRNAEAAVEASMYRVLVVSAYCGGRPGVALREAEERLEALRDLRGDEQMMLRALVATVLSSVGRLAESWDLGVRVLDEALDSGDDEVTVQALQAMAATDYLAGRPNRALQLCERGLAIMRKAGAHPHLELGMRVTRAASASELGRIPEASEMLHEASTLAERAGGVAAAGYHALRARLYFWAGRWDDALAETDAGRSIQGYHDDHFRLSQDGFALAALVELRRGRSAQARARLDLADGADGADGGDGADRAAGNDGTRPSAPWTVWSRALLRETEGRMGDGQALLAGFWESEPDTPQHRRLHFLVPDLIRMSTSLGDAGTIFKIADDLRSETENPSSAVRAAAMLAAGAAKNDLDLLRAAVGEYEQSSWSIGLALAREQLALACVAEGLASQARAELDLAVEAYRSLGAKWDAARTASTLRTLGIVRGVRGVRHRPKSGWGALTDAERHVADLVAEGKSNPVIADELFVSRRTVQSHVSSILGKLGVASRVGIAVEATRRDKSFQDCGHAGEGDR